MRHLIEWLDVLIVLAVVAAGYWYFLRPVLKQNARFTEIFADEQKLGTALQIKFAGIKQKVTTIVAAIAVVAVQSYDFFTPLVSTVDFTPLTARVPPAAWPFIVLALLSLVQWFRKMADARAAEAAKNPF